MKRIMFWMSLLVILSLASCNLSVPTISTEGGTKATDVQMQTQISQMLTSMPTNTPVPVESTATLELATLSPDSQGETASPAVEATATEAATATPESALSTNTPVPPTATVEAQPTATQEPAVTNTPLVRLPTATPTATGTLDPNDPRNRLGAPTGADPMDDAMGFVWPTGADPYTRAEFNNGFMVLTALADTDGWRMANPRGEELGDLYLDADFRTQTCAGSDHYGVIVRSPNLKQPDQGYLFAFTCDGRFSLRRWDGQVAPKGEMKFLIDWKEDPAIVKGSNQANRMGILVSGSRILLYANGKLLADVTDANFSKGYFGVLIGSDVTPNLTVWVDDMAYWLNAKP